jgi:hypothetical protein
VEDADEGAKLKLGETIVDRASALTKGGIGMIPVAGPIIAELVGTLIPNQRFDRIEAYMRFLESRIDLLSTEQKEVIKTSPEHIDLFEEGAHRELFANFRKGSGSGDSNRHHLALTSHEQRRPSLRRQDDPLTL